MASQRAKQERYLKHLKKTAPKIARSVQKCRRYGSMSRGRYNCLHRIFAERHRRRVKALLLFLADH